MAQLMFTDNFDEVTEEPIKYWKTINDIPEIIKKFIENTSDSRTIYDISTSKYHCSKCLQELDENNECKSCYKTYTLNELKRIKVDFIEKVKEYSYNYKTHYYIFDVKDDNVFIYIVEEEINYNNRLLIYPYKISNISIVHVYQVLSDELVELNTYKHFPYQKLEESRNGINFDVDIYETFEIPDVISNFVYTSNLDLLKETTLYKYTNIWDLQEYLSDNYFCLSTLTYYPIYCKQFEYLVKMKLYALACNSPDMVEYNSDFKKAFGVEKKYYPFMKEIDITGNGLVALRICPTTNIELFKFVSHDIYISEELSKYVKLDKLKIYLEKQGLDNRNLYDYYDYIRCCIEMKLNLKDHNVLFPKQFINEHDKITSEVVIANNPKTDESIKQLSTILTLNTYEDDKYVIFPANSVDSLIDESTQLSNCVRTYCSRVSNNECQIYFMRYKNDIHKSLVTIEVRDGKIVQARTKFNEEPNDEIKEILKEWEKGLIPILNFTDQ